MVRTTSATIGVDKTFDPEGFILPGVARWVDRSGGIAIGYPSFTLSVRPPNKTSRVYRVVEKLILPTLEATSPSTATGIQPAPTLAYACMRITEWILPERCTGAERAALLSHGNSLHMVTVNASDDVPTDLTGTPVTNAVLNYDAPY
jgi:hypothetical protein